MRAHSLRALFALTLAAAVSLTPSGRPVSAADAELFPLQRMKYNHPGLKVDLGVGLWAWPMPVDYDSDGDLDLLVSCPDVPFRGTWLFENPDGNVKLPTFKPPRRVGDVLRNVSLTYAEGRPRFMTPGSERIGVMTGDLEATRKWYPKTHLMPKSGRTRANQWSLVDFDGDDVLDIVVGTGTWGDYGWDNAFNDKGEWTNGPLHGNVHVILNKGTEAKPEWREPALLSAGESPIDVYGMPSPNLADFDGDGDLDLICGEFIDGFTFFQNVGSRTEPKFAKGVPLRSGDELLEMPLCMIVVTSIDWDKDGDVDLIVGQEDGRVALVEHSGKFANGQPIFAEPVFFQQEADEVKFGALVTPVSFDWDADGDEDLICGNTAGEIAFIENLDGGSPPMWNKPLLLKADGKTIQIRAGKDGSIQGPAEAEWGYTTLDVADWNHDGKPDLVVNSIWGKIIWYENVGSWNAPKLAAARPIEVEWNGTPPKPAWNWWNPSAKELATQWRTTPCVIDWDRDGLNDLVMLDHDGYLAFFPRKKSENGLQLLPGKRVFIGQTFDSKGRQAKATGETLRLNNGIAGRSGRRKLCITDWDGDGKRDLLVNTENVGFLKQTRSADGTWSFTNQGDLSSTRLAGHTTSPTTTDWNRDGRPELLVGAEDGFLYHVPIEQKPAVSDEQATNAAKPNVLFIAVDDMRCDLGCYGNTLIQSPHIDALADRGTLFERAYCQQAVCNPSRASLLTGLRLDTLGIFDLPTHFRQRRPDIVTLPQLFKNNGYHTEGIGKIFHNWVQDDFKGDPRSWSVPAVMHYATHGSDTATSPSPLPPDVNDTPKCTRRDVPDDAYFDGRIANRAVNALRRVQKKPFFLAVGFWKPHSPFNAPEKYWSMYDDKPLTAPHPSSAPKNVPAIALHDSREILRSFRNRPDGRPTPEETITLRHGYYAAISYVDAQVGKVLQELKRLGLEENTIVVLWSDHGFHLGEHSLWAKTSNFELDARVPLIIATPGQTEGRRTESLTELLDLYPTLAELSGLQPPEDLEGKSVADVLMDPKLITKGFALTQHPRPAYPKKGTEPDAMGYSLRTDAFRYTEWRDYQTGEVLATELYDHETDPAESINVAADTKHADVLKHHAQQLQTVAPGRNTVVND